MAKAVLKVTMEDSKKRAKAMKCVVGIHGVTSATQEGDKITVVGEGVDTVELTTMLRRKMGHVELLTLTEIGDQKKAEKAADQAKVEDAGSVQPIVWPTYYCGGDVVARPPGGYYYMDVGERRYYDHNSACSIL